jgi:hypothetical protein
LPAGIKNSFYKSEFSGWYRKNQKIRIARENIIPVIYQCGNKLDGDHYDAFLEKYLLEFSTYGKLASKALLK